MTGVDGALPKLIIQVRAGTDPRDRIVQTIGEGNLASLAVRDPTLEEAYINILR